MQTADKNIDHGTLRRLIEASANVGAEIVGAAGGWGVVFNCGRASQTLTGYLKALGITEYRVNAAAFEPGAAAPRPADRRSATASERMKRAHQAVPYDNWFREQVQASIDDPRPSLDDEQVPRQFAAKRESLGRSPGAAKRARR